MIDVNLNNSYDYKLRKIYTLSLSLFFIFNFIDRDISNIFLLISLLFCLIDYRNFFITISNNIKLVLTIVAFSIYISVLAFYHSTPVSELDNYFRFILLLPLMLITFKKEEFIKLIFLCAVAGIIHATYSNVFLEINFQRYQGTSSTAITFANMSATLFIVCAYYIIFEKNRSYLLIFSSLAFFLIFILTGTRGPIIGIILALAYLGVVSTRHSTFKYKYQILLGALVSFVILILVIPNPTGERLKFISKIDFSAPLETKYTSLRERIYYFHHGLYVIKDNFLLGIGPQNVRKNMTTELNDANIDNISPTDHLHNDFMDIVSKFGIFSLFLLFFIYFYLINTKDPNRKILLVSLMIMLTCSQLTQSQFAHHQAITFFITLFYLFQNRKLT